MQSAFHLACQIGFMGGMKGVGKVCEANNLYTKYFIFMPEITANGPKPPLSEVVTSTSFTTMRQYFNLLTLNFSSRFRAFVHSFQNKPHVESGQFVSIKLFGSYSVTALEGL